MKLSYPTVFYHNEEENVYVAVVPDLPGCSTGGDTFEEAYEMAIDAASGWILCELEEGKQPPIPSDISKIKTEDKTLGKGFTSMLFVDMDSYSEKHGVKSVRKSLTIPSWLNSYAESKNLNFSKILQEALIKIWKKETA